MVVVDQPASIGALPVAVAQAMGMAVAYLPGLAMRRIADLHPGNAKTDARDAYVIADAARTMPHTLRSVDIAGPAMADLAVLMGYDDDLQGSGHRRHQPGAQPAAERPSGPGTGAGGESGPPRGAWPARPIRRPDRAAQSRQDPHRHGAEARRPRASTPGSTDGSGPPSASRPSSSPAPPRSRRSCRGRPPLSPG